MDKRIKQVSALVGGWSAVGLIAVSIIFCYGNFFGNLAYRKDVEEICAEVNYTRPERVESYSTWEDVNSDGRKDIVLTLKDGSRLEYLSKGYELNN